MQTLRLDRTARLRHGRSSHLRIHPGETARLRPEENLRIRLRHGRRPHRHDEVRHQRYRTALLRRRTLSGELRVREEISKLAGQRAGGRTRSYRDLQVWQKAMILARDIYQVTRAFPREEIYGLTSQLRRAAVSVPSNIAEGHGRLS